MLSLPRVEHSNFCSSLRKDLKRFQNQSTIVKCAVKVYTLPHEFLETARNLTLLIAFLIEWHRMLVSVVGGRCALVSSKL